MQDITQDEARKMREKYPDLRWRRVPHNEKGNVTERVNKELTDQGISRVGSDVIGWRMSRAIGNLKHSEGRFSVDTR
jgi:hypothetical protein